MTDKKTFGLFIKEKRLYNNLSQKELAEKLFVTEGAISKWERGLSYPDITLVSDICRILDISEHEFITASTDIADRKIKNEARKFRVINRAWFLAATISYTVALITCFICNLAINHTLSWFFIVLTALLCAYSFVPTFSRFFRKGKLLIFTVSSFTSICLLLLTCAVYTGTLFWWTTASIGVLMGYTLFFLPVLSRKTKISRFKFLITFTLMLILTILLLLSINAFITPFKLTPAILITLYAYLPLILCSFICVFRFNAFLKAGICSFIFSVAYFFMGYVVNILFGFNENHYAVNFNNWVECASGNVHFICLTSFLSLGVIFIIVGFIRQKRKIPRK